MSKNERKSRMRKNNLNCPEVKKKALVVPFQKKKTQRYVAQHSVD